MRWFVEISILGKNAAPAETLCVEAAQWQPALQKARAMRGDDGALSNFSIELLDEGYRAIDPATRRRYLVRKAPEAEPLSPDGGPESPPNPPVAALKPGVGSAGPVGGPESPPVAALKPGVGSAGPVGGPESPPNGLVSMEGPRAPQTPRGTALEPAVGSAGPVAGPESSPVAPKAVATPEASEPAVSSAASSPSTRTRTAGYSSPGAAVLREAAAQVETAFAKPHKPALVDEATTVSPTAEKEAAAIFAPEPTVVGSPAELLSKREDDPSERSPLSYREYSYFVEVGTPEEGCEALLRARFEEIHAALRSAPSGRLVNLAVFDHRFAGKPERRPIATLTWKDWKGEEPEVRFPARELAQRASKAASGPAPETVEVAPAQTPRSVSPAPSAARELATPSLGVEVSPASAQPPRSVPPGPAERMRSTPPPAGRPRSTPPPSRVSGARVSGDDLLAELFEAFCDLHFLRDSLEGADFILSLIAEKLPSEVCLVSLFNMNKREFVVVRQNGGHTNVLLQSQPERAPIPLAAMRGHRAVVVRDAASDPRVLDARWNALGIELRSYLCAPVELSGRYLGLIELANPLDGSRFVESDGNALTYIGQQFGEFVGQCGVVTDPEVVAPGLAPPPEVYSQQRASSHPPRPSSPPKSSPPKSSPPKSSSPKPSSPKPSPPHAGGRRR